MFIDTEDSELYTVSKVGFVTQSLILKKKKLCTIHKVLRNLNKVKIRPYTGDSTIYSASSVLCNS